MNVASEAALAGQTNDDGLARIVATTLALRRRRLVLQIALGIAVPALLLAVWEVLSRQGVIDSRFFPAPSQIVVSGAEIVSDPRSLRALGSDLWATLQRLLIGYGLGATSGIAFGVLMGLYAPVRFSFSPIIFASFPIPKLAYFPLLLIIFGIGDGSKIALITIGVFFMTCINTLGGVLYTNPIYLDMARAFRVPAGTRWLRIAMPAALPAIISGLKLAMGNALILVVASEFVASNNGIGKFIWNSWQVLDVAAMFVGLIVIAAIGVTAMLIGNLLERRLIPWAS
jgi:NitT/TauT family transport system permease protein